MPISYTEALEEITAAIGDIQKWIKELHNEARENCDQHLTNCLNIAKEMSQDEKASLIKKLMAAEKRNEAFSPLKYYCGKLMKSQAIYAVMVPTSWTTRYSDDTSLLEDPKAI